MAAAGPVRVGTRRVMALAIVGGYILVMLAVARRIYGTMRESESMAPEDRMDAAMIGALSLTISILWPLAIPVALVMWHPKPTAAETRAALAERDDENRQLQRRIAELERELKIGPGSA
jgi:hypothetical protein